MILLYCDTNYITMEALLLFKEGKIIWRREFFDRMNFRYRFCQIFIMKTAKSSNYHAYFSSSWVARGRLFPLCIWIINQHYFSRQINQADRHYEVVEGVYIYILCLRIISNIAIGSSFYIRRQLHYLTTIYIRYAGHD